jgi:hypothetical protein
MLRQLKILLSLLYWLRYDKYDDTSNQKFVMCPRDIPLSLNLCKLNRYLNWSKLPTRLYKVILLFYF